MNILSSQIPEQVKEAVYDLFEPGYLEHIGLRPEVIITRVLDSWPRGTVDALNPFGETKYVILPVPMEL